MGGHYEIMEWLIQEKKVFMRVNEDQLQTILNCNIGVLEEVAWKFGHMQSLLISGNSKEFFTRVLMDTVGSDGTIVGEWLNLNDDGRKYVTYDAQRSIRIETEEQRH